MLSPKMKEAVTVLTQLFLDPPHPHDVEPSDSRAPRINPHAFLRRVMEAYEAGPWSSEEEKQKFLDDAKIVFERVVMGWQHKPEGPGGAR